jgi:N-6 DNA Methylase
MDGAEDATLSDFLNASGISAAGKALRQYCSHVAYYAATRLMLVRVWEDLELLEPMLYDGGFDLQMRRFNNVVTEVVDYSFSKARRRYRALFDPRNNYAWFAPTDETYTEVIYELANTYLGAIASDVLGQVYERLLERIDRKLLGQYYTPRDIIALIWDLIGADDIARQAEDVDRTPRVLDIATGSGGFLVDKAARLRRRLNQLRASGSAISVQDWLRNVADGLNGVEIQRFSAYLAELNLLVQLGQVIASNPSLRVPPLEILCTDTLSLHEPDLLLGADVPQMADDLLIDSEDRRNRAERIKEAYTSDFLMDVVCGNPPYIGEKVGAPIMARTRREYPYWESYVGQHMDYLYWFLILGVSKLRVDGRFGFITTEYWLRSVGAKPLRRYLARRCRIDRIVLFRRMRLFPDAPGQHSMVIVGQRVVPPDAVFDSSKHSTNNHKPTVSIYDGPSIAAHERRPVLDAIRDTARRANVRSFQSPVSPNQLGESSWSEAVLTADQRRRRNALRRNSRTLEVDTDEGVLSSADRMRRGYDIHLTNSTLSEINWPQRKAGIFSLTPQEVADLGVLNENEKAALRPVINTRDVLPYAAVLADDHSTMIYLAATESGSELSLAERRAVPFPEGMPKLKRHLTLFRPLLEAKLEQYRERRPWWSLHRPRPGIISRDRRDGWADYCLTSRWGPGERLIVGLPPAGTIPASGLHALLPPEDVPAAYLCGLFNSTVVQDLAETLPPGKLTAGDIQELALPLLPEQVHAVTEATTRLAEVVTLMVRDHTSRFPALLTALLEDIALDSVPTDAWLPQTGPRARWGPLNQVSWCGGIYTYGTTNTPIRDVVVTEDLLGLAIEVSGRVNAKVVVHLAEDDPVTADQLGLVIRGAAVAGRSLSDILTLVVPTNPSELARRAEEDRTALEGLVSEYHALRSSIDRAIGDAV